MPCSARDQTRKPRTTSTAIETNYLNALGRLAEAEGESAVYQDLRMKLFIDPEDLQARYVASPEWLRRLMIPWADGLNLFLAHAPRSPSARHPPVRALDGAQLHARGASAGDIEGVPLDPLQGVLRRAWRPAAPMPRSTPGPQRAGARMVSRLPPRIRRTITRSLLINPHTSFFFRSELQVTSDEGLERVRRGDVGAVLHLPGLQRAPRLDAHVERRSTVDSFEETIEKKDGRYYYRYGREERPVVTSVIDVPYRDKSGALVNRTFTVYRTHHGPIVQEKNGRWVSVALMQKPVEALSQSYLLTKAQTYAEFMKTMELRANSSNNTVYADREGNIAYLHPQFIRSATTASTTRIRFTARTRRPTGKGSTRSTRLPTSSIRLRAGS